MRLMLALSLVFTVFSAAVILFEKHNERNYREKMIEARLRSYADVMAGIIEGEGQRRDSTQIQHLTRIFPQELRLTVITRKGKVVYESDHRAATHMEHHEDRPEVQEALSRTEGSDLRTSITTGLPYFYFAKSYGSFLVRVALPYNAPVAEFMKADNRFMTFVLILLAAMLVVSAFLSYRLGRSVHLLRRFVRSADKGLADYDEFRFPQSDLGDLGRSLLRKYKELEESNRLIAKERERLLRHFHYFEEGISIFSPERKKIYANPIFLQYINTILDQPTADINALWQHPAFAPAVEFLQLNSGKATHTEDAPIFRFNIPAGSTFYAVQLLVYNDGSLEMTLSDITRAEKNRRLKQQMSNNITHELRTPVSSIRGYVETLLNCPSLSEERRRHFLERAYNQVVRLTDLIRDVALITKTEEAPETLPLERIEVCSIVDDIVEELRPDLLNARMLIENHIPADTIIRGNYSLVYSIFRNLFENSIRHAGPETIIHAECYNQDDTFCYFRYYDTGCGVAEEHLPRLFERFYRVSEGRTRDAGGTGLGLSIVRNAIQFHQGNISVRNRREGGLEFLFTLKK